jgi:hypothetical protein
VEPTYLTPLPNPAESEKVRDATRANVHNIIIVALPQKPSVHKFICNESASHKVLFNCSSASQNLIQVFCHKPNSYAECPLCRFLFSTDDI